MSSKSGMGIDNALEYLKKIAYEKYVSKLKKPLSPKINLGESGKNKPNRCF